MKKKLNALQKANSALRKADRPSSVADLKRKMKKKKETRR